MRLHEWLFDVAVGEVYTEIARKASASVGAAVTGRRTFDVGVGSATIRPSPRRASCSPTRRAWTSASREAAGEGCVRLMRAEVSRRFLEADLIDQIRIQVAPMLLGAGTRLFDSPGSGPIELRRKRVVKSPRVTHLWLDVAKRSRKGVRRGVGPVGAKGRCSRGGCRRPP